MNMQDKLKAYRAAKLEQDLLERELERYGKVHDIVRGSMDEHPYILHNITIAGIELDTKTLMQARRDNLAMMRLEVEQFMAGVEDPYIAFLIRLRYMEGLTWDAVAARAGGGNSESGVKSAVHRFLVKEQGCNECNEIPCYDVSGKG